MVIGHSYLSAGGLRALSQGLGEAGERAGRGRAHHDPPAQGLGQRHCGLALAQLEDREKAGFNTLPQ